MQIDTPQILNMRTLTLSRPCDLFESRIFIILAISPVVKAILAKGASVQYKILLLFSLKSHANFSSWYSGGIHEIFLLLRNVFNKGQ